MLQQCVPWQEHVPTSHDFKGADLCGFIWASSHTKYHWYSCVPTLSPLQSSLPQRRFQRPVQIELLD